MNRLVLLGVSTLGALIGFSAAWLFLPRDDETKETPAKRLVSVVVPLRDISSGTRLRKPDELFTTKELPELTVLPQTITSLDQLRNKVARVSLSPSEPVTLDDLGGEESLPSMVPKGCRALTIPVIPGWSVHTYGVLVAPGSHINLLVVRKGERFTRLAASHVLVLKVVSSGSPHHLGEEEPPLWATVAIPADDLERVAAETTGSSVYLALEKAQ